MSCKCIICVSGIAMTLGILHSPVVTSASELLHLGLAQPDTELLQQFRNSVCLCLLSSREDSWKFHGHSTGPGAHCDQSIEWQAIAILIKAMKRFVVKIFPLLRHFSGFQMFSSCSLSRLSKCIQCQVKKKTSVHLLLPWGPQHLQFLWLWPLWPIEMLHQKPRETMVQLKGLSLPAWGDNAAQALRMCAIHACPGEGQTNACTKSFAHECSHRWNICVYVQDCTGVKIVCCEKLMLS